MKLLTLFAVLLVLTVPLTAQRITTYERLVVSTSAVAIAPITLVGMSICNARLEGAAIRWRIDGTNPTTVIGTPMNVNDTLPILNILDAQSIRFIRSGAQNGILNITCFPQN
jgi:hypothetical protein